MKPLPAVDVALEDLEADPYPVYARLRQAHPVAWLPSVGAAVVTRFEDVQSVLLDHDTFQSPRELSPLLDTLGPSMLTVAPERHRLHRSGVLLRLRAPAVAEYAPPWAEEIAGTLLDRLQGRTHADLMAEFCEPLSVRVLGRLLGLDHVDSGTLRRWFAELAVGGGNYERAPEKLAIGRAAAAEVDAELDRLMTDPGASLLGDLLATDGLDEEEIRANVKLMILGGMQEPAHALGTAIAGLLGDPEQLAAARADDLWEAAVEEALRWIAPVGTATRIASCDAEIAGTRVRAGTRVAAVLASANRDPARWPDPDRFEIRRERHSHRAFGHGPHFCVGHALARTEIGTGLRLLVERFPEMQLTAPVEHVGWEFRGPRRLEVRLG